jgi:hypothetical protein
VDRDRPPVRTGMRVTTGPMRSPAIPTGPAAGNWRWTIGYGTGDSPLHPLPWRTVHPGLPGHQTASHLVRTRTAVVRVASSRCRGWRTALLFGLFAAPVVAPAQTGTDRDDWIALFNGRDLAGWTPKIAGHELGADPSHTFRVEDGAIVARYDGYGGLFRNQFGHLFHREAFSHYHLVVEYRFTGDWLPDTPGWAYRNSGVMLHAQDPATMTRDQDFPISVELQFLGGLGDGRARPTGNMCSPGTEVFIAGAMARSHCVNSTSPTFHGDQWVRAEAIVLGDSAMTFVVNGDTVLTLTRPHVGGGSVSGHDPAAKVDGTPLGRGFIALQSEGHPVEFRRVELLNLAGCTDPRAANFRAYFVRSEPGACRPR